MKEIYLILSIIFYTGSNIMLFAQNGNGTVIQAQEEMCSYPHYQILKAYPDSSNHGVTYKWVIAGKALGHGAEYQLSSPIASTFEVTLVINSNSNIYYANKTIDIKQTPSPQIINGDTTICPKQTYFLTVKEKYDENIFSSLWFDETGNNIGNSKSIKISKSGIYYTVIEKDGCISEKDSTYIKVLDLNIDSVWAESPKIHSGDLNQLEATVTGDVDYFKYRWTDLSGKITLTDIPSENFIPPSSDKYILTAYNEDFECQLNSDFIDIYVGDELTVPTAFTPNNDNINDSWVISGLEIYDEIELFIFNRWGKQIFNFKGKYIDQWKGMSNGKVLPIGVYYYVISFPEKNKIPISGTVTILN